MKRYSLVFPSYMLNGGRWKAEAADLASRGSGSILVFTEQCSFICKYVTGIANIAVSVADVVGTTAATTVITATTAVVVVTTVPS